MKKNSMTGAVCTAALVLCLLASCANTGNGPGQDVTTGPDMTSEQTTDMTSEQTTATPSGTEAVTVPAPVDESTEEGTDEVPAGTEADTGSFAALPEEGRWESADMPPDVLTIKDVTEDGFSFELDVYRYFTLRAEAHADGEGYTFDDGYTDGLKGTLAFDGEKIIFDLTDAGSFSDDSYIEWHLSDLEFTYAD